MGKSVDGRSDIYSLGIILYQLLAGQAPFAADSPVALLHQHVHELPPPLIDIRPDLAPSTYRTVDICLQKEPEYRFQTAAQLVTALQHAAVDEGLRTPTAVPTYPNIPQPAAHLQPAANAGSHGQRPLPDGGRPDGSSLRPFYCCWPSFSAYFNGCAQG